jgi:hypothetical protein
MSKETYTLEYPFKYKEVQYETLDIRRPKMRDLKKFDKIKDPMSKGLMMLADLAEISPDVVEEMDPIDFNKASEMIAGFLGISEEDIRKAMAQ